MATTEETNNISQIVSALAGMASMDDVIAGHLARIEEGKNGTAWQMPQAQRREIITAMAALGCNHLDDNQIALLLQVICVEIAHSPL